MRIGIDVGGTNTDAVLMDGNDLLAWCKFPTTPNVSDGIRSAVEDVLRNSRVEAERVRCVMIGTTHFTNAFVEGKHLVDVGVIRIALPAARGIPPLMDWPEHLLARIGTHTRMVKGGYQFDGRLNNPLDEQAVAEAAQDFKRKGIRAVAITSLFSPIKSDMESRAAEIVAGVLESPSISLSNTLGRVGLLERENAAVMNASLAELSGRVVKSFRSALSDMNIRAPFYISQNDGTLMSAALVEKFPVLTFSSGPTNSMRGAAYLSGLKNALVADIGGTTTDIGMLTNGFPRESSLTANIGGVRTNFRMPDVLALGLGGGSLVKSMGEEADVGPTSVGYQLTQRALIFGGETLTASDIAVAAGYANFGDKSRVAHLPRALVNSAVDRIHEIIADGIDRMKVNADDIPLVLVGGGAVLVNRPIPGVSEIVVPENAGVANAIGASIAHVSGESDQIVSYDTTSRSEAIEAAKREATLNAVRAGANAESVDVIEIEEVPVAYLRGGSVRLRVKVAGSLALVGPA